MNPVVRSIHAVIVGFAMIAAIAGPLAAFAGMVPDAATLERIRARSVKGVRVIGAFGQKEIRNPLMDSTGVWSAEWATAAAARPAVFATPDAPHARPPGPIPWTDIDEIQTNQQHKLQGAMLGGAIGLIGALALITSSHGQDDEYAGAIVGMPVLGALAGTFIGSLVGSKTIYRAPEFH